MGKLLSIPCSGSGKKGQARGRWKGVFRGRGSLKTEKNSQHQAVNYETYTLSFQEWGWCTAAGVGLAALTAYVFYRDLLAFLLFLPFGMGFPFLMKRSFKRKRLERLAEEFKEGIRVLSASLGSGYSVENAFRLSVEELTVMFGEEGLIVKEFSYVVSQMGLNRPVEGLLADFGRRSGLEDVRNFAEVFRLAKRSGGRLGEIMDNTAGVIRDKMQVQEDIRTATASRRMEQRIMSGLPFGIVLYVDLTSPGFFDVMYTTGAGRMVMTVCLGVYLAAVAAAWKILEIEV